MVSRLEAAAISLPVAVPDTIPETLSNTPYNPTCVTLEQPVMWHLYTLPMSWAYPVNTLPDCMDLT